jgi:putative tricarboxylic transport membrane protein
VRLWRVAAPLAGVALAAALWPPTRALSELGRDGQLSPAFWPRLALLGLALACLAKAVQEARRPAAAVLAREPISWPTLGAGVALVVLYAALVPVLGFPVTTAAFIVAFMALAGLRSTPGLGVSAVVGTIALVYVFVKLVYLPLPKGDGPFEALTLALYRALGVF